MRRYIGRPALCLFVLLCAAVATADSDVMCICTDDGSASTCGGNLEASAFSSVTFYFGVLEPSHSQVLAWEAWLDIEGDSNLIGSWTVLGADSYVISGPPEFVVGTAAAPITPNSANIIPLLSYTGTLLSEEPVKIFIRPIPNSVSFPDLPGYAPEAQLPIDCTPCNGGALPAFSINFEPETQTWGEVKSLYD